MILATILWFLFLLSFLVVVHELGHFLAAKWMGVHVQEFGLGYPPRVRSLFRRWGTLFSLNAIPVGGFVKLYGDDAESLAMEAEPGVSAERMFTHKPQWSRLVIVLAGVAVNFVFGILAFAALFSIIGIPTPRGFVEVTEITAGSPAEMAGFALGDMVQTFTVDGAAEKIQDSQRFIQLIEENKGKTVEIAVRRNGDEFLLAPQLRAEKPVDDGYLGVGLDDTDQKFYPWWQMPVRGVWRGLQDSLMLGRLVVQALGDMVGRLVTRGEVPKDLAGPVGIVDQAYQADILSQGPLATIHFAGQLSVNLAIMNLLPIPALDGGRAVFIVLESVIGKKRRALWEQKANMAGFVFLVGLILLVTAKDIFNLFR